MAGWGSKPALAAVDVDLADLMAILDMSAAAGSRDRTITIEALVSALSSLLAASPIEINVQTGTSYTLVLDDAGKLVTCENGSNILLTIPANTSVAFPVGTQIRVSQLGAGVLTVKGATGVIVNGTSGGTEDLAGQYSDAFLTKLAENTWLVTGSLSLWSIADGSGAGSGS